MDNAILKEEGFLRIITTVFIAGFTIIGCVNPNPGVNFASKESPEEGLISVLDAVESQEELDLRTARSIEK